MHVDLRMIPHESTLLTIGYEHISLEGFVRHSPCEGFCPSTGMADAMIEASAVLSRPCTWVLSQHRWATVGQTSMLITALFPSSLEPRSPVSRGTTGGTGSGKRDYRYRAYHNRGTHPP